MLGELKRCPFCGNKCDVQFGLDITFFCCTNDNCSAVISFKSAEDMVSAIKQFNKRKVEEELK